MNAVTRVLGIDPGTHRTGFALLERSGRERPKVVEYGTWELKANSSHLESLLFLHEKLIQFIEKTSPSYAAVEEIFINRNLKTAAKVMQARGVILLSLAEKKVNILEPTVTQIKKGITGKGNADKKDIRSAVKLFLGIDLEGHDDSWDAVACAFTGFSMIR